MDKGINFQTDVKFDHGMGPKEAELRWEEPHHRLMRVEESQLLFKGVSILAVLARFLYSGCV